MGAAVSVCGTFESATESLNKEVFDVVLTGLSLQHCAVPVIVVFAYDADDDLGATRDAGFVARLASRAISSSPARCTGSSLGLAREANDESPALAAVAAKNGTRAVCHRRQHGRANARRLKNFACAAGKSTPRRHLPAHSQALPSASGGSMMKRWLIGLSFALLAPVVWALPSVADVQAQVRKGHYAEAESMMREVVAAKPGNARAHYVYAEILAHNDRFAQAAEEAARARTLDPSLKFSDPEKFRAFEQLVDREQQHARSDPPPLSRLGPSVPAATGAPPLASSLPVAPQSRIEAQPGSSGLPGWVWPAAIVALGWLAWRMLRRSSGSAAGPVAAGPAYGPAGVYPPGPGYGPGGIPGAGSGLMGVGLAAAGGVAAGMLAEKLLERGHEARGSSSVYDHPFDDDRGSDVDARALENRDVDFGSGNDWGDGGGSIDVGGGSDDGGGW